MIHPVRVFRTWRHRWRLVRRMGVGPTDRVLEVGSGQNPSPRANVLCERFLLDDTERSEQAVRIDRPLVVGDVYRLPFSDQAFDFVICSHVLEHLERPEAALAELTRVAPRGYIETPSRINEKLRSFPFHRWMVSREGRRLVFREKERPIWDDEVTAWFLELERRFPPFYDFFIENAHEMGNLVSIVWEGEVEIQVERRKERHREERLPGGFVAAGGGRPTGEALRDEVEAIRAAFGDAPSEGWRRRAEGLLGRLFRLRSDPRVDLDDLLACPACGGALRAETAEDVLRCGDCAKHYPVLRRGSTAIPFLVAEPTSP